MASDIPMPKPTVPRKSFTSFKSLSFDIYGTLVDWESSIIQQCKPLYDAAPADSPYKHADTNTTARLALAGRFNHHEAAWQTAHPSMKYDQVLKNTYLGLAEDCGINPSSPEIESQATKFGLSVGDWLPFPDTVEAMQRLAKYYKLVPLSNVDNANFARTQKGPLAGVDFWRVYVAEDIGSYKPDLKNFEYLLEHLDADDKSEGGSGIAKEQNLMVAQGLYHDHRPCKQIGMSSVWINRKGAGMSMGSGLKDLHDNEEVGYGWRFPTLGEFADAVEKDWAEKS